MFMRPIFSFFKLLTVLFLFELVIPQQFYCFVLLLLCFQPIILCFFFFY